MKILCVGEMLIDFTPVAPDTYKANPGGAPANVAVSTSRNGIQTGFLGKLGNDDFGKMLKKTLEDEGIEVLCPELTDEATTTLAFVTLDKDGDRSFTFARKPGADMLLTEEDIDRIDFTEWDLVHAGSVSQSGEPSRYAVLKALKKARENNKLISFDINFRDKIWDKASCKEQVDKILPLVDLLKISEEEVDFVGGIGNIDKFMIDNDIKVIVVTMGGDGTRIFFRKTVINIEACKVDVKDTTGAGDAFWGGFLGSLLRQGVKCTDDITEDVLRTAGRYGAVSGGLCVSKPGGIPAIPTIDEIENAL